MNTSFQKLGNADYCNILSFRLQGQERGEGIKENIINKRAMLAPAP